MADDPLLSILSDIDQEEQQRKKRSPRRQASPSSPGPVAKPSPPAAPKKASPSTGTKAGGEQGSTSPQGTTWWEKALGVTTGLLRAPFQAAGATVDLMGDLAPPTYNPGADVSNLGLLAFAAKMYHEGGLGSIADAASARSTLGQIGDPTWNQVSTEVLSYVVGGVAGIERAVARGATSLLAKVGAGAVGGAVLQGTLMDPEQERLANVLQGVGVENEFVDWLAHDDDEGRMEARFKNALEGAAGGAVAESLFRVGKYWVKALRGKPDEAAAIQAEIRESLGDVPGGAQPVEIATPEEIASLSPPSAASRDLPEEGEVLVGWGRNPDGTLFPQYGASGQAWDEIDEVADAIRGTRSATPEELDSLTTGAGEVGETSGGAAGKTAAQAADDASPTLTSPEVVDVPERLAPPENLIVFRAGAAGSAEARLVGAISREDLKGLGDEVRMWQSGEEAIDITRPSAEATRTGEWRLAPLGSVENVGGLLRGIVSQIEPPKTIRADADLMVDAARAASVVGEDPTMMLEAGRLIAGSLAGADTAMATLRTIWVKAAGSLDEINLPGTDWMAASDESIQKAAQMVHDMTTLSAYVQQAKQGLGRGLRVNQLPDAETYLRSLGRNPDEFAPMAAREMSPLPRTRKELSDWMELWRMTKGSPEQRAKLLEGLVTVPTPGKYLRNSFANFFTASILSAPRTILLNVVGPGVLSVVRNVERMSGAMAQAVSPFASSEQRAAARLVARHTVPAYFQTLGSIQDAFREGLRAAEQNHTILGGGGSFDAVSSFGPFTANLLGAAGVKPSPLYSLGNLINVFPRALARVNNGMDEFSKRMAYLGEVRIRALVEGAEKGFQGEDLRAFVRDKLAGSVDEIGHAADADLLRSAERTTLTAQVGEEGTLLRKLGNGLQAMRRDIPETRYILPVFNVPANALGETLRRLPIARVPGLNTLAFPRTAAELAGDYGPVARAEAHGRFLLGSSFLLAGIMLNRAGVITGAGPREPTDRRVWLQTHQPYSIRSGDKWIRYDRLDILGGLLSIPATISDETTHREMDEGAGDLMFAGMGALAQWFKDRAAIRTAANFVAMGDDPTKDVGTFVTKTTGNILSAFAVPNAIKSVFTDTSDPYLRMKREWTDYLRAAVPGLSRTLEPVRNVLGEPMNRPADTYAEAFFPVLIASATSFAQDPVIDELDRLYQSTGYGAGADPKSLGYGFFDPRDVELEDGRSIYDRAMQARQTMRVNGSTLKEALADLFTSQTYEDAVDADPNQKETSLGDLSRGWLTRQVFDSYNKAIKRELAAASPRALAFLTAAAAKQKDDAYLRDFSAQDLVDNPELYATRGVDAQAYSEHLQAGATGALLEALPQ